MTKEPPLLPSEVLRRVLRVARCGGTLVLAAAGALAVASAAWGDYLGAAIGVIVAGAGVFELHGTSLLKARRPEGVNWLVASQLYLLVSMLAYCALYLSYGKIPAMPPTLAPMVDIIAGQYEMTSQALLLMIYRLSLEIVAVLTLFYQGGMAVYYHRRRAAITAALGERTEGSS